MSLDNKTIISLLKSAESFTKAFRMGSHKSALAETLGKDKSTIAKEIKLHLIRTRKCTLPLECPAYQKCKYDRICDFNYPGYVPFHCLRRDLSPGTCNGCSQWSHCHFNK